jgi:hypothetical protein
VTEATRSYRPGPWFGIFGERATVLLPPSEKARVGRLWEMVDDGAGFDVVLDALISAGLRDLPGFVLVSPVDGETKVVVRGEARAVFTVAGESVEVAGSGVTTWAERSLTGVTATRIEVGDDLDGAGPLLHVDGGLVRVGAVQEPAAAAPAGAADLDAALAPVPEPTPEPAPVADPAPLPEPEPLVEPEPVADPAPEPAPAADTAPPGPIGPEPGLTSPPPPVPPVGAPSGPPPPVMPPPVPPVEHDGDTMSGEVAEAPTELGDLSAGLTSRPVARLVLSSGDDVEVDRAVLVGRAPEARRFTSGDQPRLVQVPSPAQEISSTHLEIRPGAGADHGSAVVTDLGSTNGTVLVQPGLPPEDLQPGIAVQLIPGAIIDLGDGVTIQVINP